MGRDTPTQSDGPHRDPWSIIRDLRRTWQLFWDPAVPWWPKVIPLLSLAYLVWPLEFVPDAILGLGQLDDLGVILLGAKLFVAVCASDLVQRRVALVRRQQTFAEGASGTDDAADDVIDTTYRVLDERP